MKCGFVNNKKEPNIPPQEESMSKMVLKYVTGKADVTEPMPTRNPKDDFNLGPGIRDWWIGHATNLIQVGDKYILTDPHFGKATSPVSFTTNRLTPPACEIEDLPEISFVLISHCHYDHLDKGSIKKLYKRFPNCQFFAPLINAKLLEDWGVKNIVEFDWRTHVTIGNLDIYCFPASHEIQRGAADHNAYLWCSWLVSYQGVLMYYTGDTIIGPHFREIKNTMKKGVDLFITGIGPTYPPTMGRHYHMDPQDAWDMSKEIGAVKVTPIHYGTFPLGLAPEISDIDDFIARTDNSKMIVIQTGGRIDWNGTEFVKGA